MSEYLLGEGSNRNLHWNSHRNGSLSPTDITTGERTPVWWQCDSGHEWLARAYAITAGSGCPYCSGRRPVPGVSDLATTHPDALKYWSDKNLLSPTEVSAGSHKKVIWKCDKGHEWEAIIRCVVIEGNGCPYCAGKKAIAGETDLATRNPEITKEWDYEKNGDLMPNQILPLSHKNVWWKCDQGHSYQSVVFARTRRKASGCPYCCGKKPLKGVTDIETLRPDLAKEWYQPLNGDLKPSDVTLGSNRKVWWQCKEGHIWKTVIYARTREKGTGCPVCAGMIKQEKRRR